MQRKVYVRPSVWVFLIVIMCLCFGASGFVHQMRYEKITQRVEALNDEKLALMDHISELDSQLSYVSTDAYVERVARDELNMIRPGEIRYVSN